MPAAAGSLVAPKVILSESGRASSAARSSAGVGGGAGTCAGGCGRRQYGRPQARAVGGGVPATGATVGCGGAASRKPRAPDTRRRPTIRRCRCVRVAVARRPADRRRRSGVGALNSTTLSAGLTFGAAAAPPPAPATAPPAPSAAPAPKNACACSSRRARSSGGSDSAAATAGQCDRGRRPLEITRVALATALSKTSNAAARPATSPR